jgi:hypothetical protein
MNKHHGSDKSFAAGLGVIILTLLIASGIICFGARKHIAGIAGYNMSEAGVATSMPLMDMDVRYGGTGMGGEIAYDSAKSLMPIPPQTAGSTAATAEPRIIKTGNLSLEVSSARDSAEKVGAEATKRGGFVQSSNTSEDQNGNIYGNVTVRVPSDKFEETMSAMKALAIRVSTDSVNGEDVTEQYTDIEARLRNAKAQETQYLAILEKAETVQDILSVQQYLSGVRYEIESLEGQLKYLGNKTDYSTINVSLFEEAHLDIPNGKFDLMRDIKEAGRAVILLAQAFLTFAIWFVIIGAAFALPISLVGYIIYRAVRKLLRK